MSFPTNIIEAVRTTCHRVATSSEYVHVDDAGVANFAKRLLTDEDFRKRLSELEHDETATQQPVVFEGGSVPRRLSVHFKSFDAELNFACILGLLQLGSGYRKDLHRALGWGASDTMTFGAVAMQNALGDATAAVLAALPLSDVQTWFRLTGEESLTQLSAKVHEVLVGAGRGLLDNGYASFAALVTECTSAAELTTALCCIVPGFADCADYRGEKVWFAKKAQLAVTDVHARLVAHEGPTAGYPDVESLTVFVDNVLPAVLRAEGVIVLSDALKKDIDSGVPLASGSAQETELRACAVDAAERIVEAARAQGAEVTARGLDWLLWTVGKRPDLRAVQRHACRDTLFY